MGNEALEVNQDIERMIHRLGSSASEVLLDFPCNFFSVPAIDGVIGYRIISNCAVVYGDPVALNGDVLTLAEAFHLFCQENQWHEIYILASESFAKNALGNIFHMLLVVGEELIFNPQLDPSEGHQGSKLRNYVNHALHNNLIVEEYLSQDDVLEKSIQQVGEKWLRSRHGPQIYLGHLNFFENRLDKRWFYVKNGDQVDGVALISRLDSKGGWFLKFLVTVPHAVRGTSELLMMSVLNTLKQENCDFLTYGMVPAEALNESQGLGKVSHWFANTIFQVIKKIFQLGRRKFYWQKYHPRAEKLYIVFSAKQIGFREFRALCKAFKINYYK